MRPGKIPPRYARFICRPMARIKVNRKFAVPRSIHHQIKKVACNKLKKSTTDEHG